MKKTKPPVVSYQASEYRRGFWCAIEGAVGVKLGVKAKLARQLGVTQALITKWNAGLWEYIPERRLVSVLELFKHRDRITILAAYLNDLTPAAYRGAIRIQAVTSESVDLPVNNSDLADKLRIICEAYDTSADVRASIDIAVVLSSKAKLEQLKTGKKGRH